MGTPEWWGIALTIFISAVTVIAFFLRMDWQITRLVDLNRGTLTELEKQTAKLDKLDRRIDRLFYRALKLSESDET